MTYEQALLVAIGALSGAVVFMYAWWLKAYEHLRKDHTDCITRERITMERVIRLEERTGTEKRSPVLTMGNEQK